MQRLGMDQTPGGRGEPLGGSRWRLPVIPVPEVVQVAERSPRVCLPGSLLTHRAGRRLLAQDSAVTAVRAAKALRGRRQRVRELSGVKRLDRHALPFVAGGYNRGASTAYKSCLGLL